MSKVKLKKGDKVIVISGNSKGNTGEITKILADVNKAVVKSTDENKPVYVIKKHSKPNAKNPQGGINVLDAPIYISKLAIIDPTTNKPSRIGFKIEGDIKIRVSKKSGNPI